MNSRGIERTDFRNGYSVACGYSTTYVREEEILVPHGETDLSPHLAQAIERANKQECWRACGDVGPTFVEAISHGCDICPWTDGLAVPERLSEAGMMREARGIPDEEVIENQAVELLRHFQTRFMDLSAVSEMDEKTDTGVVWDILNDFLDRSAELTGEPSQRSP